MVVGDCVRALPWSAVFQGQMCLSASLPCFSPFSSSFKMSVHSRVSCCFCRRFFTCPVLGIGLLCGWLFLTFGGGSNVPWGFELFLTVTLILIHKASLRICLCKEGGRALTSHHTCGARTASGSSGPDLSWVRSWSPSQMLAVWMLNQRSLLGAPCVRIS